MTVCENNHKFEVNKLSILQGCVLHCHACGYSTTVKEMTAIYSHDLYSPDNKLFHVFYFYPTASCKNCGTSQITYAVLCSSTEEALENYENYKKVDNIAKGAIQ